MNNQEIAIAILHGAPHTLSGRERRICETLAEGKPLDGDGITRHPAGGGKDHTVLPADDFAIFRQLEMLHIAHLSAWHDAATRP